MSRILLVACLLALSGGSLAWWLIYGSRAKQRRSLRAALMRLTLVVVIGIGIAAAAVGPSIFLSLNPVKVL